MRASPQALRQLVLCRRHFARWASRRPHTASAQQSNSVYDSPAVYDAAFGLRDFDAEAQFLVDACRRHGPCPAPKAWLELACGPGRHTRLAAFDHGLRAVGLDLSPAMVAYAQQEAERDCEPQQLSVDSAGNREQPLFVHGDMCTAQTHAAVAENGPFDIICLLLGSLSHLTHLEQAAQCFSSAKALLSSTGTFIVEMNHPRHLFDGSISQAARRGGGESSAWEVPGWTAHGSDGRRMDILWGAPDDAWDAVTQVLDRTVQVHIHPGADAVKEPPTHLRCQVPSRLYTAGELHLLAASASLRVVALYGDLEPAGVELNDPHAERLVAVMTHAV
jgi:SAM-dependent methyltransferase